MNTEPLGQMDLFHGTSDVADSRELIGSSGPWLLRPYKALKQGHMGHGDECRALQPPIPCFEAMTPWGCQPQPPSVYTLVTNCP
jgi:hypothetical protein